MGAGAIILFRECCLNPGAYVNIEITICQNPILANVLTAIFPKSRTLFLRAGAFPVRYAVTFSAFMHINTPGYVAIVVMLELEAVAVGVWSKSLLVFCFLCRVVKCVSAVPGKPGVAA